MISSNTTRVQLAGGIEVSVNADLLRLHSGFFSGSARMHPNPNAIVHLPEACPTIFSYFTKWLTEDDTTPYPSWQNICGPPQLEETPFLVVDNISVSEKCIPRSIIDKLIDAWILGDFLLAPAFQNFVMDHISVCYNYLELVYGFPLYNLQHIFRNTTEKSMLRDYIIKGAFFSFSPVTLAEAMDLAGVVPMELPLALALVGLTQCEPKWKAPWSIRGEPWHVDVVDWAAEYASRGR